ncbi:MAG: sugar ABC transporter substrate-binding protein [Actinobacteria bacterium]|nr:sugar ABC transporter substrate-binding protein [Actinomycetota bacterium]
MKKITSMLIFCVLLVLIIVFSLSGCKEVVEETTIEETTAMETEAPETTVAETTAEPQVIKVAFSSPYAGLPFFQDIETGMKSAIPQIEEKANVKIEFVVADAKGSAETMIKDIETFITEGVDVIYFVNLSTPLSLQLIGEAQEAGILVGLGGTTAGIEDIHFGLLDYQGAFDTAQMVGSWVKENLNSKNIAGKLLLCGSTLTETMRARNDGVYAGLTASGAEFEKVVQLDPTGTTLDATLPIVVDALTANPEINMFIATNDPMALACLEAAKQANLNPEEYVVSGYGLESSTVPIMLEEGSAFRFDYTVFPFFAGNFTMHGLVASVLGIIEKNPDGTPYSVILPGAAIDVELFSKYYTEEDGKWIENIDVLRSELEKDPYAAKILQFQN